MRVWADQVGLLARLAQDFETADFPALEQYFDLSGLEKFQATRTPRAWQLIAEDGFRNEIFQTSFADLPSFVPEPAALQGRYRTARGVHLHADPQKIENWVRFLRENPDLIILWEPWDPFCQPENLAEFYRLARQVDIVSPNINESRQLTSIHEPEKIALEWRRNGVKKSLIRLGAAGCQVCGETGDPQTVAPTVKKLLMSPALETPAAAGSLSALPAQGACLKPHATATSAHHLRLDNTAHFTRSKASEKTRNGACATTLAANKSEQQALARCCRKHAFHFGFRDSASSGSEFPDT